MGSIIDLFPYPQRPEAILRAVLTTEQAGTVWGLMHEAEVRSLYFADLATRYTKRKQAVIGLSFLLSSGAALTAFGDLANWVPSAFGLLVAVLTGYALAANLDQKVVQFVKLQMAWEQQSHEYKRLRQHWYEDGSERALDLLLRRERELSGEATSTGTPWKPKLMAHWEDFVYAQLRPDAA